MNTDSQSLRQYIHFGPRTISRSFALTPCPVGGSFPSLGIKTGFGMFAIIPIERALSSGLIIGDEKQTTLLHLQAIIDTQTFSGGGLEMNPKTSIAFGY